MLTPLLLGVCVLTSLVALFARSVRAASLFAFTGSTIAFVLSLFIAVPALLGFVQPLAEAGLWYVDGLSACLVLIIGFVQWTATIASMSYLAEEVHEGVIGLPHVRRYWALLGLFILSMFTVAVSNNLGFMWIALEATTLATILLVAFYARPGSLEAAWKYLILCSTGIALGLIGLIFTSYAASLAGGVGALNAINWTNLLAVAPSLSPTLMKVAFAFILIGYGTKVGLAPMHTWLPDAHSSAPSPISGMLSGVLLNTALFAVFRYKALVDGAMGASVWTNTLLLGFGTLTCILPAAFILVQKDYKRLLAYSSIEHMGLITFSAGLGALGLVASLIQMIGHALIKPLLFFGAGNILLRFKSTKFERVSGVVRALPYTGGMFLAGVLLLLATPPSPLFVSEYLIVSSGIAMHPALIALILFALAVIFAGFVRLVMPMLFARGEDGGAHAAEGVRREKWNSAHTAMLMHLVLAALFGISLWGLGIYHLLQPIAALIS